MKKQATLPKDPRSEAALMFAMANWNRIFAVTPTVAEPCLELRLDISPRESCLVAVIDLREMIRKRQPLTGIKKQVSAIVRGEKKVAKKPAKKKVKK